MTNKAIVEKLKNWIKSEVPWDVGLLVPVSGGSDSAFCFWVCNQALPGRVKGVFVGSGLRSEGWFHKIGEIEKIGTPDESRNQEVFRWALFLEMSLHDGRVLVGTRNRTENVFGTFSLASRVATRFPIIGIWKSRVMDLCEYAGVPDEIIASSMRADPDCGRPEELSEIPLVLIDTFLQIKEREIPIKNLKRLTSVQVDYLEKIYKQNLFKRSLPFIGPSLK